MNILFCGCNRIQINFPEGMGYENKNSTWESEINCWKEQKVCLFSTKL